MKKPARLFILLLVSGALLRFPAHAPASALDDLTNAAGQGMPNVPEPPAPTRADDDDYAARRERYRQMQEEEEREREARRQRWEQEARERRERDERERQQREAREQADRERQDEMRREQQRRDQENRDNRQRAAEDEQEDRRAEYRRQEQQQQLQARQQLQAQQQRRDQEERARQEELRRQQAERERQERIRQEQLARERREAEERARQEALRRQREEEARQARLRAQAAAARSQWAADDERNGGAFDDIFAGPAANDPNTVDLTTATGRTPAILRGGGSPVSLRIKPPPVPRPEATVDRLEEPPEPPPPPPRWQLDLNSKLTDLGFAYVSMYLKSKVDGLASIPELTKDALDLHKRLREHTTGYLDKLFATAGQAADPNADLGALSDRTWSNFQNAAANFDEDAHRGMQNNAATMSGGSLPEGSHAAEVGIGQGQAQLQDTQELVKWCEEQPFERR